MNMVLKKGNYILGRIGLNFGGFGEQLNLFWGFGEHKQNTFRELRQKNQGFGEREQGPPGGLIYACLLIHLRFAVCFSGLHS